MSKYLLNEVKTFRCDSEMEANQLVQNFKSRYDVKSHVMVRKDKKDETYFIVKMVIIMNLENDPHFTYTME